MENRFVNHEEISAMKEETDSPRKEAIVAVSWDPAPTVRELLTLRVADLQGLPGPGAEVELYDPETCSSRTVPLGSSAATVDRYLRESHPAPRDGSSPLFPDLTGYEVVWTLDTLSREAGISKEVNPDTVRSSRMAVVSTFSEPGEVCERFGL